jgi:hypothetical protein
MTTAEFIAHKSTGKEQSNDINAALLNRKYLMA